MADWVELSKLNNLPVIIQLLQLLLGACSDDSPSCKTHLIARLELAPHCVCDTGAGNSMVMFWTFHHSLIPRPSVPGFKTDILIGEASLVINGVGLSHACSHMREADPSQQVPHT